MPDQPNPESMPEPETARQFVRQAREFNQDAAKQEIINTLEEAARQLERQADFVRRSVTDLRQNGIHEVEAVVRAMLWMVPKLGIDQLLALVAQYNRNYEEN